MYIIQAYSGIVHQTIQEASEKRGTMLFDDYTVH